MKDQTRSDALKASEKYNDTHVLIEVLEKNGYDLQTKRQYNCHLGVLSS